MSHAVMDDPYLDPSPPVPPGEHVLTFHEDGSITGRRKEPDERANKWKGAKQIAACDDDKISVIGIRESGIIDYRILDSSVSWRGLGHGKKRQYLCHTCVCNLCPHTKRIDRYREERGAA